MLTEQEKDFREERIGYVRYNVSTVPQDKDMAALHEKAESARLALPRIANMRKSGVRTLGGLEWLRRCVAPETWNECEFSRRIKVGTLDEGSRKALDEIMEMLRVQISVVEILSILHREALTRRTARELESWWRSLGEADRQIGMQTLKDNVGDLESHWSKAGLDERIDLMVLAMWSIEENHKAAQTASAMEAVVASVAKPASANVA